MNEFVKSSIELEEVGGIFSEKYTPPGDYDHKALLYDKVMGNSIYNLLMWGNLPEDYKLFAKKSINYSSQGAVLDVGCGTLSFTHQVYENYNERPLILSDLSYEMLKIAKNRLNSMAVKRKTFLRADAMNLPFKDETFQTVLCFGVFHTLPEPSRLIKELYLIIKPGGDIHISSLCTDRKFSGKYLEFLRHRNLVSTCLCSEKITEIIEKSGFTSEMYVKGGMTYIDAAKFTQ